jgi:Skp family chaperone for outer membrane proteins
MKKVSVLVFCVVFILFAQANAKSQVLKIGVFDIELMVQAMPAYREVDSLMTIYNRDSLGALREYYELEYNRLDSTYKADSAMAATGQKSKAVFDMLTADRQKAMLNIVYWQQIAQDRSDTKRAQLSEKLFKQVSDAYKKVLARKKYTLVLKPNTYEAGFRIDNIFIAVARELKLTELPQELIFLGDDPDPVKQPATTKPPATKPKN